MAAKFDVVITDEACTYAAIANSTSGWYLSPFRWELSEDSYGNITEIDKSTNKQYGQSITYNTRTTPFLSNPFSAVTPKDNTLLHSIVIPPDVDGADGKEIKTINFIYKDMYGNEFLYAVGQSQETIKYVYGTRQQLLFSFAINPTKTTDTYLINYTYPQEIQDHNVSIDAHTSLLKRDGTRTATNILSYETSNNFTSGNQIIDKNYVDNNVTSLRQYVTETKTNIETETKTNFDINCPIGSMIWWPSSTLPDYLRYDISKNDGGGGRWMVRNGAALSKSKFSLLYSIIGDTYTNQILDSTNSTDFRLPDDAGLFIRAYSTSLGVSFGTIQESAVPNITGHVGTYSGINTNSGSKTSALYSNSHGGNAGSGSPNCGDLFLDASRCSNVYKNGVTEARPINRNYLPIIKVI